MNTVFCLLVQVFTPKHLSLKVSKPNVGLTNQSVSLFPVPILNSQIISILNMMHFLGFGKILTRRKWSYVLNHHHHLCHVILWASFLSGIWRSGGIKQAAGSVHALTLKLHQDWLLRGMLKGLHLSHQVLNDVNPTCRDTASSHKDPWKVMVRNGGIQAELSSGWQTVSSVAMSEGMAPPPHAHLICVACLYF